MSRICLVVPCYDEEKRLDAESFRRALEEYQDLRFVLVNDGSGDATGALLESLRQQAAERIGTLHLPRNSGKAEAVRRGVLQALESEPHYVGYWDADLSTPLDAVASFARLLEERPEIELVMGARVKLLGRRIERRVLRHYLGRVYATAVSLALDLPVYDTQCGAKLFRVTPGFRKLFEDRFLTSWSFDVELIARLIRDRRSVDLAPVEDVIYEYPLMEWRHVKGSKIRPSDYVRMAFEVLRIHRTYSPRVRRKPPLD